MNLSGNDVWAVAIVALFLYWSVRAVARRHHPDEDE